MNRRFVGLVGVPVAVGSLLIGIGRAAGQADAGTPICTAGLLRGGYGVTGTGAFAGADLGAVGTLVFDGSGGVAGKAIAVVNKPAAIERFQMQEGTYSLEEDCTGTMRFFTHHLTLGPIDHFHTADLVVSDGGKRISFIFVTTEFRDGSPSAPAESFTFSGHRI